MVQFIQCICCLNCMRASVASPRTNWHTTLEMVPFIQCKCWLKLYEGERSDAHVFNGSVCSIYLLFLNCMRASIGSRRKNWHTTLEMLQFCRFIINNLISFGPEKGGGAGPPDPPWIRLWNNTKVSVLYADPLIRVYSQRNHWYCCGWLLWFLLSPAQTQACALAVCVCAINRLVAWLWWFSYEIAHAISPNTCIGGGA
jgi:hypothetical protein